MANFITEWSGYVSGNYDALEGFNQTTFTPVDCEAAVMLTNVEVSAPCRAFYFLASDNENFGVQYVSHTENNQSQSSTNTVKYVDIQNAGQNTHITSASNGGDLLNLANRFKDLYFAGVTQTASSLKAFLDQKYGEHKYYYYFLNNIGLVAPDYSVSIGYFRAETSSIPYTYPMYDNPTWDPEVYVDPTLTMTGQQIQYPSYIPPSAQSEDGKPELNAWWIFRGPEPERHLQFDVYINGTKDPNVAIRWKAVTQGNVSLQLVTPIVWCSPNPTLGHAKWAYVDGIYCPDETNPWMKKYANTFAGAYTKPYLTEFETDIADMPQLQRVAEYGVDGIANEMYYQMRFNYQVNENNAAVMTWGDAFGVTVPREVNSIGDISVFQAPDSASDPRFTTSVVIHLGTPEDEIPDDSEDYPQGTDPSGTEPGVYDPDYTPFDFSSGTPIGYPGKAILTRTYSMDATVLQNIGSKLWSQSYFDVLKIQSNPIENIVSCKWFPFSRTGAQTDVKVGDVNFQIQAGKIDAIYQFHVGSVKYHGYWTNEFGSLCYLDGSPYTVLLLHLPWCGVVELDASMMINQVISVDYVVDLITGDCVAFITINPGSHELPYMSVSGHVGVDIPLTSTDRIQSEIRAASTTFSAVGSAAAGIATGNYLGAAEAAAGGAASVAGMDVTSQRSSAHSNACMSYENKWVFLEIWRPALDEDLMKEGFKARHGWPCHKYMTLSSFKGFTKCSQNCKIDFAMTSEENKMIEQLLTSGIYI